MNLRAMDNLGTKPDTHLFETCKVLGNNYILHIYNYPFSRQINRYGVPPTFVENKNKFVKVQSTDLFSPLYKRMKIKKEPNGIYF
ncbi:MAG: hypothetical protein COW63_09335 [Bacteroidetes bacterium CG18_big_fil_WC_8_21_14_2_50_41_14]|nr:MAG: hypothetical protein COW63_09335 [Bacteroidetes bacterium CG18_big_fil_WC_8_21_14_2_50_41_14]